MSTNFRVCARHYWGSCLRCETSVTGVCESFEVREKVSHARGNESRVSCSFSTGCTPPRGPAQVTYSAALQACARTGAADEALALLHEMRARGIPLRIEGRGRSSRFELALLLAGTTVEQSLR